MIEHSFITLAIVVVTGLISYKGFKNQTFFDGYMFEVDKVLINKDYVRLISSGFLHNSWRHMIFNMLALYAFGNMLEPFLGPLKILLIYFLALVGGNLLALLINKNNGDYNAAGASGAVNGIVFASIALFPYGGVGFFFIPASIPSWVFGIAYVLFSIYGIKSKWGNSGHEAHLGGAIIGMLMALCLYPEVITANLFPILAILLPALIFLLLIIYKPGFLLIDSFAQKKAHYSIDHEYNYRKAKQQSDVDSILEKIHRKGMKSLTLKEKETLERFSKISG